MEENRGTTNNVSFLIQAAAFWRHQSVRMSVSTRTLLSHLNHDTYRDDLNTASWLPIIYSQNGSCINALLGVVTEIQVDCSSRT